MAWRHARAALQGQEHERPAAYDAAWVDGFVEQLSEFDARINQAVVDSGVLAGVPRGALARAGARRAPAPGSCGLSQRRALQAACSPALRAAVLPWCSLPALARAVLGLW